MTTANDTKQEELASKEHEQQLRRIKEEITVYQLYMANFMADKTIRRTLQQNGVGIHECSIWFDDSENNPGVVLVELFKGSNKWFKLILDSNDKNHRIWIDLKELEQTYAAKK